MKLEFLGLIFIIACASAGKADAQAFVMREPPQEVLIQGDRKGTESFNDQICRLTLSTQNNRYEQEVVSKSGRRYKLFVTHNLYFSLRLEHWVLELREIPPPKSKKKENLGFNLLEGKQIFPKERFGMNRGDSAGVLYPEEKSSAFSEEGEPLYGNGQGFYFFKTTRKINIENFCVVIKAGDYKFNPSDENKLDLFEVFVEFASACKANK